MKIQDQYKWKNIKPTILSRIADFPADIQKAILQIEKGSTSSLNAMFHGTPYEKLCYKPFQNRFESAMGWLGHPGYRDTYDMTPEQMDRWKYWLIYCERRSIEPTACFEDWMA